MKKPSFVAFVIALTAIFATIISPASAQISYDSQELVYLQSFDTLPNSGSSFIWTDNATLPGWYVGSSASSFNGTLGISTGSTTTGNIYSFGLASATDRALGSIASGSTNFYYGLKAINNTATTITGFTIRYTGEQWRNSAAAVQSLSFQYSLGASGLKTGTYTSVPVLGFASPVTGGTAGLLNGNLTANRLAVGPVTVSNINWLPGTSLWLRFTDIDDAGYDHGLAIDDFSLAAAGSIPAYDPPPGYYDAAVGLTGEPLAAALHTIISNNAVIPYSSTAATDTKAALKVLFEDPADSSKIQLTYSGISILKTDNSWDRERIWPTARGIRSVDNANSDLFNLRPSYSTVNSARNDKFYDNSNLSDQNYVAPATALTAVDTSADTDSWQPSTNERGDLARALFYMDVRYNGGDGNALDLALDNVITNGASMAVLSTLVQWSHADPVSEEERRRNASIYSLYQHNRNPFVDHPEYVDSVFGYLVTEADDLDLDGMPNDWENAHQLNPTDATDANADADGDGLTNFEEYWMGSDPHDAASPARFIVDGSATGTTQDGSAANPYKTIQAAINATATNELRAIVVRPGTYNERPLISGKNTIHLFSEAGAALTIIDGQQVDSSVVRLYSFQKASVVGFTVRNAATTFYGGGLRVDGATGTALIANNIITANASTNSSAGGGGLYLKTADGSRVINNFILGNRALRGGGVLFAGGDVQFWFNTVAGNTATGGNGGGLSAMQGVHPDVRDNIIWNNTGSIAAQIHQISGSYARNNLLQDAAAGSGNIAADPLFIGNGDYHIAATSPARDTAFALPVVSDFDGDARPGGLGSRDLGADEIVVNNTDPIAENQSVALAEDTSVVVVLGPDLPVGWTYSVLAPSHGSVVAENNAYTYHPSANYNGTDSFAFKILNNGQVKSTATVSLNITPVDDAPLVDAGANQVIALPAVANLVAIITDIDTPATRLTYTWSQADGPGTVNFATPNAPATTAAFSLAGDYLLLLTVSDGTSTRSDSVKIVVNSQASLLSVTLNSPANNSSFTPPTFIPLMATVSGGTATKVEFYEGSRRVGRTTTDPYTVNWNKSLPGIYRLTAMATDAQGRVAVSAPILINLLSSNTVTVINPGPGNDGGGSGSGGGGGSNGGGDGEGGNLDPNGDDDGDGTLNGDDAYPQDDRRKEDIPVQNYAVIDLGEGVIPAGKDLDQIAMGEDGRVAFSWWDGNAYQVAKWKEGHLEANSPKNMATKLTWLWDDAPDFQEYVAKYKFTENLLYGGGLFFPTNPPPEGYDYEATGYSYNAAWEWPRMLNANGDVATIQKNFNQGSYHTWPLGIWRYGETETRCANPDGVKSDNYIVRMDGFFDDGRVVGLLFSKWIGEASQPFSTPLSSWNVNIPALSTYASLYNYDVYVMDEKLRCTASSRQGTIALRFDGLSYQETSHTVPQLLIAQASGNPVTIQTLPLGSNPDDPKRALGKISVLNDSGAFVLSGNWTGKSLYYKDNASVGALKTLLPTLYSEQFRYGADAATADAEMSSLSNSGQLLFSMENLEGTGRGTWKKRTFVSNKIEDAPHPSAQTASPSSTTPPDSNLRSLQVAQFPENYDITLKGGAQGTTDKGILAAIVKKTKNDDGTPIPPADQKKKPGYLMHCALAVDANRDGTIDFDNDQTTTEKPFRFWINDDHDISDTNDSGEETTGPADNTDNEIKSKRDLEDFFQLHLYIGGLQEAVKNGKVKVGLAWRNVTGTPSIKVYRAAEPDGGNKYLKPDNDEYFAAQQTAPPFKTALGSAIDKNTANYVFQSGPDYLFGGTASGIPVFDVDHPTRNLLVEGVGEGKGQLVMTFYKEDGTTKIGEGGGIWLDIKNIKKLYLRAKAESQPPYPYNYVTSRPPLARLTSAVDSSGGAFEADPSETKDLIVFVHGYNMDYAHSDVYAQTMFKRLWQRGFKGRFASFRWPTYGVGGTMGSNGDAGAIGTYNDSEYVAWNTGLALKAFVAGYSGTFSVNVVAHSLGNAVVGQALRDGMSVKHYALLHAAIPAACYSNAEFSYAVTHSGPSPDNDSDLLITMLPYKNWLGNIKSNKLVNFSNSNDTVIGLIWDANNAIFKPQNIDVPIFYDYSPNADPFKKLSLCRYGFQRYLSNITDAAEAKSYADYSSTGTIARESMGGSILDHVDDSYFGDNHSNEWVWKIQKLNTFYNKLLQKFGLDPIP